MVDLSIVALYLVCMLLVGLYAYRRKRVSGADGFFVANRKASGLLLAGSLFATIIGASATVGLAGWGFTRGLTGAWWLLVGAVGLIVLGLFWAKKVRQHGLYTLPELVEKQYGREAGLVASILIVVSWVGIIAAQIVAAGKVLSVLVPGSTTMLMVICALVFIAYTALGAQYSIIRTDFIQSGILMVGIFVALFSTLHHVGWIGGLTESLPSAYLRFPVREGFDWSDLVTLLIVVGATYVVGPDIYSRLFCAKSEGVARSAALWTAAAIVPAAFAIAFIGMGAKVLFPGTGAEQAFPTVIQELLPIGLSGLVIAALLAAIMSSADTCLLTTSTILTEDIYRRLLPDSEERHRLKVSRGGIAFIGLLALLIALKMGGVISSLLMAYTVFTSGVVIPVLAGFHKKRLRVNSLGALVAVVGGGGTALAVRLLEITNYDLVGLGVCIVLLFSVSWVSERVNRSSLLLWYRTQRAGGVGDREVS
ncbi:MAG: sodium:solute symporter family protein [Chloroflexi bacterium]|nr:MAG: sodium:solute symporter family protein [Chloroflexota bacterium]